MSEEKKPEEIKVEATEHKTEGDKKPEVESKPLSFDEINLILEKFFTKTMPEFPKGLKEFLVKFIPWITLIIAALLIPIIVIGFGLGALVGSLGVALGARTGINAFDFIGAIISLASIILTFLSLPGLFNKQFKGWQYAYWNVFLGAIASIAGNGFISVFSIIISVFLNLYILFQIKSYYKN